MVVNSPTYLAQSPLFALINQLRVQQSKIFGLHFCKTDPMKRVLYQKLKFEYPVKRSSVVYPETNRLKKF